MSLSKVKQAQDPEDILKLLHGQDHFLAAKQ